MANPDTLIEELSGLSILEMVDLVKKLETKWGVSATPVAVTASSSTGTASTAAPTEEKSLFDVYLSERGSNKISVIKEVRSAVANLGLAEAKALVESAPKVIKEGVSREEAEEIKRKIEAAGAKVEIR
ncbi:MAG: 50S ribosomal protein L7/L12 [Candidatus Xiphinematobacter sp.]|nr:MAG: 50S ribosomal protein L7/L12 [Candidatus Xiphinematobacter sp.]QQY08111.1 MAG: 50S ribosomal protein L7/L12 [Candidatus Xiphinematobacter sp.]QQY09585.1 MAG: 50S ribosomal protein L7/L12 [Candidatus Xiphinematobacter sp.]QQY10340.1 MAG: 50S ribosomal protein L7/L12 [Candidatus Xiphinematobacter sp.]